MAESDLVALPDGALDDVASRVGASLHGSTDGTGLRIGIACAEFNGGITLRLLDGALEALNEAGTDRRDVTVAWAPGAFELPVVARAFAHAGKVDAVLCLGAVIRGRHRSLRLRGGGVRVGDPAGAAGNGRAGRLRRPDDRHARAGAGAFGARHTNKGREAALTGIEMVRLLRSGPLS